MIRRLGPGDERVLQALAARFKAHVPDDDAARTFLADERNVCFAALGGGEVLAFAYGYVLERVDGRRGAFLYDLEVAEAERRRGLGRALTEAFLDAARAAGAYKAWVQTDEANDGAKRTYAAAGAVRVGDDLVFAWDL